MLVDVVVVIVKYLACGVENQHKTTRKFLDLYILHTYRFICRGEWRRTSNELWDEPDSNLCDQQSRGVVHSKDIRDILQRVCVWLSVLIYLDISGRYYLSIKADNPGIPARRIRCCFKITEYR